ncbi:Protein SABRE [Tilletia horrida]|uniref:Protein SABRE n=1 Tax=Tilletia horrida TaxID=155126 RepID=A0AAN6GRA2_9BASI|nr:Protein SABRE [Tilletia horrida]KAK0566835.1 Protein SABRE [Tilletia horrida]
MTAFRDTFVGALTTCAILVLIWLFCRSALPRLPRILFRGRLRIRRVGVRGIRGLEWSSKGFVSSKTKRRSGGANGVAQDIFSPDDSSPTGPSENSQNQHHPDAFVVRISHIYLSFHRRDKKHRSWATLHIQGVGVRIPRTQVKEAESKADANDRDDQAGQRTPPLDPHLSQRERAQREESRLQKLMLSPPSSPSLKSQSRLHQRRSSLLETVTAGFAAERASARSANGGPGQATAPGTRPALPRRPFSSLIPNTSASSFRTIPLYVGWQVYAYIRNTAIPKLRSGLLKVARLGLFFLASLIPVVSSLFEVEIHRLEVYVQDAETVLRVGRVGARYSMTVVSARNADRRGRAQVAARRSSDEKLPNNSTINSDSTPLIRNVPIQADGWSASMRTSANSHAVAASLGGPTTSRRSRIPWLQNSVTEMVSQMPNRIGSGAKGAAAFVMAGVPAANGSLKLTLESIQVFEALFVVDSARSDPQRSSLQQNSAARTKRDSFFAVPSPGLFGDLQHRGSSPHQHRPSPLWKDSKSRRRRQTTDPFADQILAKDDSESEEEDDELSVGHRWQHSASSSTRVHARGHQRSGSSDAAMGSTSMLGHAGIPQSSSGDGNLFSPYQTTTARWFDVKNQKSPPGLPLSELLASPPITGSVPQSESMHSIDSGSSESPHDSPHRRFRPFNLPSPTASGAVRPGKLIARTESERPWLPKDLDIHASSSPKRVGFAETVQSPLPLSRNPSSYSTSLPSAGRTLKRSSSTSKLNTMNTLSLSGFTDRWADWALEPIAQSTFSSDSGWANSAQGLNDDGKQERTYGKTIPDSARLLSLPGLSVLKMNFVLAPSMQIRQREAIHVGMELAEASVGIEAVMKVTSLVKARKEQREAARRNSDATSLAHTEADVETLQATEEPLPLTPKEGPNPAAKDAKARIALAQLGSFSLALPRISVSHVLRTPQIIRALSSDSAEPTVLRPRTPSGSKTLSNRYVPSDVQLEAVLRNFHFELRTSDHTDPEHQKWLGTCGVSNPRRYSQRNALASSSRTESLMGGSITNTAVDDGDASGAATKETTRSNTPASPPLKNSSLGKAAGGNEQPSDSSQKKTLFSRSVRGKRARPPRLIEHRRAFQIETSIGSFELRCATDADLMKRPHQKEHLGSENGRQHGLSERMSDLLILEKFKAKMKSTWTPFGLMPSLKAIASIANQRQGDSSTAAIDFGDPSLQLGTGGISAECGAGSSLVLPAPNCPFAFFATDPNEQAVVAEFDVNQVSSYVHVRHASALAAIIASIQASKIPTSKPVPKASQAGSLSLPRLSVACCARELSFRLDASNDSILTSSLPRPDTDAHRSLVVAAPSIEFAFHGSYADAYAKRPSDVRKAAYRAFGDGQLSYKPDDTDWRKRAAGTRSRAVSAEATQTRGKTGRSETPSTDKASVPKDARVFSDQHPAPKSAAEVSEHEKVISPIHAHRKAPKSKFSGATDHFYNYTVESNCSVDSIEACFGFRKDRIAKSRLALTVPSGADLPPFGMSHQHIFSFDQLSVGIQSSVPAGHISEANNRTLPSILPSQAVTDIRTNIGGVSVDMWDPQALDLCRDLISTFTDSYQASRAADAYRPVRATGPAPSSAPVRLLDKLPGGFFLFTHIGSVQLNAGGPDKRCESDLARGVALHTKEITFEYVAIKDNRFKGYQYGTRSGLSLPEDIRVNANSLATIGQAAEIRMTVIGFELIPLLDAETAVSNPIPTALSRGQTERKAPSNTGHSQDHSGPPPAEGRGSSVFAPAVWDFQKTKHRLLSRRSRLEPPKQQDANNYIVRTSRFDLQASCRRDRNKVDSPDRLKVQAENDGKMLVKVELLHTYCLLTAAASLKSLLPARDKNSARGQSHSDSALIRTMVLDLKYELPKVDLFIALPSDINVFVHAHRLQLGVTQSEGIEVLGDTFIAAVESARVPVTDLWEEALRLRKWRIVVVPPVGTNPASVDVAGTSMSVRIPTDFQFYQVIESATVAFKATKQLVHQFLRNSAETIIHPVAERPKKIPSISLKLQMLNFEAEDDPIETRLNLIWRAGTNEQRRRFEREQTFEEAAADIMSAERGKSSISLTPSVAGNNSNQDVTDAGSANGLRQDESPSVTVDQARHRLDVFNGSEWIRRHKSALTEQQRRESQTRDSIFGPQPAEAFKLPIKMAPLTFSAPLVRSIMTNLHLEVKQPSFPFDELPEFLHTQGAGMPRDMLYSTIIPAHLRLRLGEWRIVLRDYPLPILHVPPVDPDKADGFAWDMSGDICLAEQLGGPESIRHVPTVVVPASTGRRGAVEYGIAVPKMVMPVKFYGSPTVQVHTPYPVRIVWGQSVQPAIHDVQRVIESITSPPHDPSPRLPFWDKIPLLVNGQFQFQFSGGGDLHFFFKGSRDPYEVTGHGAGWVMCWRDNVELRIGYENKDREFFQVVSTEYLLAIPDLQEYTDLAASGNAPRLSPEAPKTNEGEPTITGSRKRYTSEPRFRKVCLRLSNGVRWGAGLIYERTCTADTCRRRPRCQGTPFYRECRFWDRIPHWEVHTKSKEHVDQLPDSLKSDSYEGWRSHHIHPSLSIFSPKGGLAGHGQLRKQEGASNSLYFSPLAWEHFWRWIGLFSSVLTLPIRRQGKLFPYSPPQSAKLSSFIGTIKYRFKIEPLSISHFYHQPSKHDLAMGMTTLVGVKARVESFHADLHQRQEETIKDRPELDKKLKVFHKPFNEAEVDCAGIDLRTIFAKFSDSGRQLVDEVDFDAEEEVSDFPDVLATEDELQWYDIDDFVELDWQPPSSPDPDLSINQTMVCPRFHYYRKVESKRERKARQASHDDVDQGHFSRDSNGDTSQDPDITPMSQLAFSKFGNEPTHTCLVGTSPSSPAVQAQLAQLRLDFLNAELHTLIKAQSVAAQTTRSDAESLHQGADPPRTASDVPESDLPFETRIADLRTKIKLIQNFIQQVSSLNGQIIPDDPVKAQMFVPSSSDGQLDLRALYRDWETFHNRYFIHNPIIYFSTETRNALLKYYMGSRIRKGFAHHMTAKAVRYVRNLRKTEAPPTTPSADREDRPTPGGAGGFDIKGFLIDKMQFVMAETPRLGTSQRRGLSHLLNEQPNPRRGLSDNFTINKSNVAVLLKPQVVLQAKGPLQSSVIITAKRVRLQNYSVLEDRFAEDALNARLMYRNFLGVDSLQAFSPTTHCQYVRAAPHRTKFAYVPLETLIDEGLQTRDFDRIISSTDAIAVYDKFNRLRVNDSNQLIIAEDELRNPDFDHLLHHMDLIQVKCPRLGLSADSNHFAAIYAVVTDLLLYRDPVSQDHTKRLEDMLFNYDFQNLDALSDVLTSLQARVRQAKDLLNQYQEHFNLLNKEGKADLFALHVETLEMIKDLDLLMRAITAARDHQGATDNEKKSALRLNATADELSWHMMGLKDGEQLAKLSIKDANFSWLNKADNSTSNSLTIGDLQALNIRPDAHFAEIISKYTPEKEHPMAKKGRFLFASWVVLAPVGGIAIIEDFELNLHPVRLSIELKVGREIMDYVFGSKRRQALQDQEARIIDIGEDDAQSMAKSEKKGKKKGLFKFLGTGKSKENASHDTLTVASATPRASEDRERGKDPESRGSPVKRQARSRSRPPSERRRSIDDARDRSRTRDRGRHRGDKDADRGGAISDGEDNSDNDAKQQREIARRNAESMRKRASTNRTFVNVKFAQTILCLSYKGDKQKSITDLFDLVFRAPTLEYRNQTCGYEDLVNFCKKDIYRAAWDQRSSLLKGILHRPRKTSRNMRDLAAQGLGSAVGRIKGQERVSNLARSETVTGKSRESILSGNGSVVADDEDDDEDDEDEDEDDEEPDENELNRDMESEDSGSTRQGREFDREGIDVGHLGDSWSGKSDITAELDSSTASSSIDVGTPLWHSASES